MSHGFFLTIEGIEGVGKTTAIKWIESYLISQKKDFILTREPGGTDIAEKIRQLILTPHPTETLVPDAELLLLFAARAQHIAHVIRPALASGKWVVSDRFIDATFAYQGGGRKMNKAQLEQLEKWIVQDRYPNITILLDADPELGLKRAKARGGAEDRIESEKMHFFHRVREAYLQRAKEEVKRFRIIDASQSLETVQRELKKILDSIL